MPSGGVTPAGGSKPAFAAWSGGHVDIANDVTDPLERAQHRRSGHERGRRSHAHFLAARLHDRKALMARYVRRDGLLLRVGSKRWKWWQRNRLRMMGRAPLVTKRRRVVWIAKWAARQPGAATSYLYGGVPGIGQGTHTDCSGFVLAVYARVGVHLPRTSQQQFADAPHHPTYARPGDLIFYNYEGPHTHVGIKVGADTMIGDQHTGSGIVRVTIDRAHKDGTGSYLP